MSIPTRGLSAAGVIALSALALTGCAGGGQTKQEACVILAEDLTTISSQMQEALSGLNNNPEAAVGLLRDAEGSLKGMAGKISNDEVAPTVTTAVGAFSNYTELLDSMLANPTGTDLEAFQADTATFQTAWQELSTVCR